MFTGIVEEIGTIREVDLSDPLHSFHIGAERVRSDVCLGDSIAVNGTCLTVTGLADEGFSVGVMPETLRRTNLGALSAGSSVNLERALQPQSRLGGHFVQGHVDGTGTITTVTPDGSALAVCIATSPQILRYIVEKGYVTVDGASLTVTDVDDHGFGIALISYTQVALAPSISTPGHTVNLEVDMLAKYVEKLVVH